MPITAVEALELGQVLGSLLSSIVQAQAESARATVDFVESIGFEAAGDTERMRTVRLRYTKKDENGESAEFEVQVPLLALVNIPSLAVREAKLILSYDVVTASTEASTDPEPTLPTLRRLPAATLTGFIRPQSPSTPAGRRTASLDLEVTLEQQAVPIGVERLFDLAELGITEEPAPEEPA
jgi:hypothetical protein